MHIVTKRKINSFVVSRGFMLCGFINWRGRLQDPSIDGSFRIVRNDVQGKKRSVSSKNIKN
jgi:hypothetical protein